MSAPAQTPISNRGLDGSFSTIAPYNRPLALPSGIASIDNIRLKFVYSQTAYDFDSKKRYDTLEYLKPYQILCRWFCPASIPYP